MTNEFDPAAGRPVELDRAVTARPKGHMFITFTRGVEQTVQIEDDDGNFVSVTLDCNFMEWDPGCYRVYPHLFT